MGKELEEIERECRERHRAGASLEALVTDLNALGVGLLDSIKTLRNACGISLGEAKRAVTAHPLWRVEVQRNEALHDAAEWVFEEEDAEEPQ